MNNNWEMAEVNKEYEQASMSLGVQLLKGMKPALPIGRGPRGNHIIRRCIVSSLKIPDLLD